MNLAASSHTCWAVHFTTRNYKESKNWECRKLRFLIPTTRRNQQMQQQNRSLSFLKCSQRQMRERNHGDLVSCMTLDWHAFRIHMYTIGFQGGSTSFSCKIYFAEQFDMLRKSCGCDEIFISSLARCTPWDTAGGKSGSIFLKTKGITYTSKTC